MHLKNKTRIESTRLKILVFLLFEDPFLGYSCMLKKLIHDHNSFDSSVLLSSKIKLENCILFSCCFSPRETNRVAHALARCIEHVESFETGMEKGPKDRFVSSLYLRMMFLRVCLMNCFWFKKKYMLVKLYNH